MNRVRSIAFNSLAWLLTGTMLYLGAIRFVTDAPWPVRLIGYGVLLVMPFTCIHRVSADFGVEFDMAWMFLPVFLSGFIPFDSSH